MIFRPHLRIIFRDSFTKKFGNSCGGGVFTSIQEMGRMALLPFDFVPQRALRIERLL